MKIIIGILVIIGLMILWMVSVYNKLISLIEIVKNCAKQIDIQLDRRYKVFENLINVVKKYMDYEKSTLKEVVALRNQAQTAKTNGDEKGRVDSENKISKIFSGINVVFEKYPDLKANQNAMQLQEEIVSTENKLAYAKQSFNDAVTKYNMTKNYFFQRVVVSFFQNLNQKFTYWELSKEAEKEKEEYMVKM